nr:hypothetical protein [Tanacetum cinerariifolium]GFB94042.1 hypothetical protein [Tanacetum cinerariifolium]
MCEIFCQSVQKKQEEKRIEEEQAAKAQSWKLPVCYNDDDDEEGYNSLNDNIIFELPSYSTVTPTKPIDSLSMGDEHLNTIPATESDLDDKSLSDEDVREKIYSNPLSDEEIIPMEIDQHSLNVESDLIESMPNHDSSEDDDDSERDISILEELLDNYSLSLPTNESYHFDIPSHYRPPAKP